MNNIIDYKMSNEHYHANNTHYSSSQLKVMLKSPEDFHRQYILGERPKVTQKKQDTFDIGTAYHTKVLEPEKYDDEVIVYDKGSRKGDKWEEFKKANSGKIILTSMMNEKVQMLVNNTLNCETAAQYMLGGKAEGTVFTEIDNVPCKIRWDYMNEENSFLQDLKSADGLVNEYTVRKKIAAFDYDLSAAFYIDALATIGINIDKFVWIFASKTYRSARVFIASDQMIANGRAKYKEALQMIKFHTENGWNFDNSVLTIDPIDYDLHDDLKKEW